MAYEKTSVDAMKSWGEVCKVLYSHGCEATSYAESPEGFIVSFLRRSSVKGVERRIVVKMPVHYDFSKCKTSLQCEQEKRTKWRSLFHYIKATFDAVDKGIVTVEQAFMADVVMKLRSGGETRVIDAIMPQLSRGFENPFELPSGDESGTGVVDAEYKMVG